jgi:hypothetical protein
MCWSIKITRLDGDLCNKNFDIIVPQWQRRKAYQHGTNTIWLNIPDNSSATLFRSILCFARYAKSSTHPPCIYSITSTRFVTVITSGMYSDVRMSRKSCAAHCISSPSQWNSNSANQYSRAAWDIQPTVEWATEYWSPNLHNVDVTVWAASQNKFQKEPKLLTLEEHTENRSCFGHVRDLVGPNYPWHLFWLRNSLYLLSSPPIRTKFENLTARVVLMLQLRAQWIKINFRRNQNYSP